MAHRPRIGELLVQVRAVTPELLQEAMAIVHDRAKARLQDKLTHGVIAR